MLQSSETSLYKLFVHIKILEMPLKGTVCTFSHWSNSSGAHKVKSLHKKWEVQDDWPTLPWNKSLYICLATQIKNYWTYVFQLFAFFKVKQSWTYLICQLLWIHPNQSTCFWLILFKGPLQRSFFFLSFNSSGALRLHCTGFCCGVVLLHNARVDHLDVARVDRADALASGKWVKFQFYPPLNQWWSLRRPYRRRVCWH